MGLERANLARSLDLLAGSAGTADVLALLGEDGAGGEETAAVYARVSTGKQAEAGNLE